MAAATSGLPVTGRLLSSPAMELYQLRAFIAVAQHGQLLRASEHLHVTQSALSKQIKSLESELNVLLFDRSAVGMVTTPAGRQLLPLAQRMIETSRQMAGLAASICGQATAKLRLGTIIDPESIRLGPLFSQLLQFYPHVEVTVVHGLSGMGMRRLRDGELDACFYLGEPGDVADLCVRPLALEHYVVIAPVSWAERLRTATWEDLTAMPWLSSAAGTSRHGLIARHFEAHGLAYRPTIEVDEGTTVLSMMRAGVALTVARERVAAALVEAGDAITWPGARLPCPLSLLYRKSDHMDEPLQALLSTVSMVLPGDETPSRV